MPVHPSAAPDTLTQFAEAKLAKLQAQNLRRELTPTHRLDGLWMMRRGRRLLSFDAPLSAQLETWLAALKGYLTACVFGSGYLANIGTIPT